MGNPPNQTVAIIGLKSSWWPVTIDIPQELILVWLLLNVFVHYLDDRRDAPSAGSWMTPGWRSG